MRKSGKKIVKSKRDYELVSQASNMFLMRYGGDLHQFDFGGSVAGTVAPAGALGTIGGNLLGGENYYEQMGQNDRFSSTALRRRDRNFKNIMGDTGKALLNQSLVPFEALLGKNFYDPNMKTTAGQNNMNYQTNLLTPLSRAVGEAGLNKLAPGAGTATFAAGNVAGSMIPDQEAMQAKERQADMLRQQGGYYQDTYAYGGSTPGGDPKKKENKPIYTPNPSDPRIQMYHDSMTIHRATAGSIEKLKNTDRGDWWYLHAKNTEEDNKQNGVIDAYTRLNYPKPVATFSKTFRDKNNVVEGSADEYKEPVQPVVYRKPITRVPYIEPMGVSPDFNMPERINMEDAIMQPPMQHISNSGSTEEQRPYWSSKFYPEKAYGGYTMFGGNEHMMLMPNGGMTPPQYEAEGGEVVEHTQGQTPQAYNGQIQQTANDFSKIEGPSHENGGVPMNGGERIYSNRLRVPGTKYTFAEAVEGISKKMGKLEKMKKGDPIARKTVEIQLERYKQDIENLFQTQEAEKQRKGIVTGQQQATPQMGYGGKNPNNDPNDPNYVTLVDPSGNRKQVKWKNSYAKRFGAVRGGEIEVRMPNTSNSKKGGAGGSSGGAGASSIKEWEDVEGVSAEDIKNYGEGNIQNEKGKGFTRPDAVSTNSRKRYTEKQLQELGGTKNPLGIPIIKNEGTATGYGQYNMGGVHLNKNEEDDTYSFADEGADEEGVKGKLLEAASENVGHNPKKFKETYGTSQPDYFFANNAGIKKEYTPKELKQQERKAAREKRADDRYRSRGSKEVQRDNRAAERNNPKAITPPVVAQAGAQPNNTQAPMSEVPYSSPRNRNKQPTDPQVVVDPRTGRPMQTGVLGGMSKYAPQNNSMFQVAPGSGPLYQNQTGASQQPAQNVAPNGGAPQMNAVNPVSPLYNSGQMFNHRGNYNPQFNTQPSNIFGLTPEQIQVAINEAQYGVTPNLTTPTPEPRQAESSIRGPLWVDPNQKSTAPINDASLYQQPGAPSYTQPGYESVGSQGQRGASQPTPTTTGAPVGQYDFKNSSSNFKFGTAPKSDYDKDKEAAAKKGFWGDMMNYLPAAYNMWQGTAANKDYVQPMYHPYERRLMGMSDNMRFNIEPQLTANRRTYSGLRDAAKKHDTSANTYMQHMLAASNQRNTADAQAYGQKQNMDNQYKMQGMNMINALGQNRQGVNMDYQMNRMKLDALQRDFVAKGLEQTSGANQLNRQMRNQEMRDRQMGSYLNAMMDPQLLQMFAANGTQMPNLNFGG